MTRLLVAACLAAAAPAAADVVTTPARGSVPEAVANLTAAVEANGGTVFAVIDHAKGAASIGEALRPTVKVIFGNPRLGTPAMQAAQTMGLALPLEMLVWEDADGVTQLTIPDIAHEADKHGLPADHPVLARMTGALAGLTRAAAGD